jgi:hypothetical protein
MAMTGVSAPSRMTPSRNDRLLKKLWFEIQKDEHGTFRGAGLRRLDHADGQRPSHRPAINRQLGHAKVFPCECP